MSDPIKIWPYEEAPEELKISKNGGDEDWLAEIPPTAQNWYLGFLESGTPFGCFCVDKLEHPTKTNWQIWIGSHS